MAREIWFRSNSPTHRELSNFWSCTVTVDGVMGDSAEHIYQALKCSPRWQMAVLSADGAVNAMRMGRRLGEPHADPQSVMRRIVHDKFTQNRALMELLLDTGDAELIEDNRGPWGGRDGGSNWLGAILMELRDRIEG